MKTKIHRMSDGLKSSTVALVTLLALATGAPAETVTFGSDANQFSITFTPITTAYGLGATEVLRSDYTKFYALTHSGDVYADNVGRTATETQCRVNGVKIVDFINWLNTSSGYPAAYTFNGDHTALVNWNRNPGAKFFLPTASDWDTGFHSIGYAPGPCAYEWIQDTDGAGGDLDGVDDGSPNKSWDDGIGAKYNDTGFRVVDNPAISIPAVPEPSAMMLLGCGLLGVSVRRRRI